MIMGKIIEFPCVDHYDEYEEYYGSCEEIEDDYGNVNYNGNSEVLVKDGWVKGFIRKCLMFILMRL